jgi:hypothetical protein
VGTAGSGKSTLIEVIIGKQFNLIGAGATRRPVFFNLVNNLKCEIPRVVVKRDSLLKEFDRDQEVNKHTHTLKTRLNHA